MKIAVLGYGTIGSGVVEIVNTNAGTSKQRSSGYPGGCLFRKRRCRSDAGIYR